VALAVVEGMMMAITAIVRVEWMGWMGWMVVTIQLMMDGLI
jgi:hypothetical protein